MANLSSIARPYALAAFKHAKDKDALADWKAFLESCKAVAQDQQVIKVLENPETPAELLFEFFQEVLQSIIDKDKGNFLHLVALNKRMPMLPAISDFYNGLYAAYEKSSKVKITTAIEPEESFRQKISDSLTKRLNTEVMIESEIDEEIIGGALIQVGDRVIDGSVRGKLQRLADNLLS